MCTVTIVPLRSAVDPRDGGRVAFRLVANRDELRTRAEATPPAPRSCGPRTALYPVDPDGGGTWIGVNDAGLAMSLLNLNLPADEAPRNPGAQSRGAVIPELLGCPSVADAVAAVLDVDPNRQRPFRLVIADRRERAMVRSDGRAVSVVERGPHASVLFATSSGLGDHVVEGPRRTVFDRYFAAVQPGASAADGASADDLVGIQDAFHRHFDPDASPVSVSLIRERAMTVSLTEVTVADDGVTMTYRAGVPHLAAHDPITVSLELQELTVG